MFDSYKKTKEVKNIYKGKLFFHVYCPTKNIK